MSRRVRIMSVVVGVLVLIPAFAIADELEKTKAAAQDQNAQLYFFYDVLVNPAKALEYESALKKEIAIYVEYGTRLPDFVASTDDSHYYIASAIGDYAGVDKLYKEFSESREKMGKEKLQTILKGFDGTYESARPFMWYLRQDLSYSPVEPRVKPVEQGFVHYTFAYIKPGKEDAAEAVAKRWKALYESKAIPDGYILWVGDVGTDMPVYCFVSSAKSPADYYAQESKNMELLGNEATKLNRESYALIRKIDIKTGRPRPDLLELAKKE